MAWPTGHFTSWLPGEVFLGYGGHLTPQDSRPFAQGHTTFRADASCTLRSLPAEKSPGKYTIKPHGYRESSVLGLSQRSNGSQSLGAVGSSADRRTFWREVECPIPEAAGHVRSRHAVKRYSRFATRTPIDGQPCEVGETGIHTRRRQLSNRTLPRRIRLLPRRIRLRHLCRHRRTRH